MEMNKRTWGDKGKPPVILLHALACHSGWWNWVAPYLENDYYLIAPDLRGHGHSGWAESYRFEDYAADIEELAKGLNRPYAIVGHSMGGYVGLNIASRNVYPPSALLVCDMKVDSPEEELAGLHKAAGRSARTYETLEDAVAKYKLLPPQHNAPVDWVTQVAEECFHQQKDGSWCERFDRRTLAIENVEAARLAALVTCPVQFVRAKESQVMPEDGAKQLAQITNGTLQEIDEAFHHLPLEAPEELAKMIRSFLVQNNF
jgi:pimeloyl-ACP methyl ester carboxylesterase